MYLVMILYELGSGFRPIPIVCVRDTKVGKFLGLGRFVEKVWWMFLIAHAVRVRQPEGTIQ